MPIFTVQIHFLIMENYNMASGVASCKRKMYRNYRGDVSYC